MDYESNTPSYESDPDTGIEMINSPRVLHPTTDIFTVFSVLNMAMQVHCCRDLREHPKPCPVLMHRRRRASVDISGPQAKDLLIEKLGDYYDDRDLAVDRNTQSNEEQQLDSNEEESGEHDLTEEEQDETGIENEAQEGEEIVGDLTLR
ncbi:hypothetical protein P154DRAFT_265736 [Amniculicola lignicola CBS 123094]|uniref:Uncharacterized protein n=1 Tax=Amniculicola lignicola CBS 123094 TaxID=1392246 RepID=A0A6A5WA55_9PLEO|nr:hypothetical protein P154DRAFT_265736 [Amniculicola lignicola CBS 123094]